MRRTLLTLILTAAVCVLIAPGANAASPDAWSATGPSATVTGDVLQYVHNGRSGTWTMQATAGDARKVAADWRYKGYHAYFRVQVAIEQFVIRDGVEIVRQPLVSASADACCSAPSGGFEYGGTGHFDVQPGDVYGFRMTGSNNDRDARLLGTLTLTVRDLTAIKIVPKITGKMGADGWYTSDVEVAWEITYPADYPVQGQCAPRTLKADTAGMAFTCQPGLYRDNLRASVTVKRDATPPVITLSGQDVVAPDALAYRLLDTSWYTITSSDALSGLTGHFGSIVPDCSATNAAGTRFAVSHTSSRLKDRGTGYCLARDRAGNQARVPLRIV